MSESRRQAVGGAVWGRSEDDPNIDESIQRELHRATLNARYEAQLEAVAGRASRAAHDAVMSGLSADEVGVAVVAALTAPVEFSGRFFKRGTP